MRGAQTDNEYGLYRAVSGSNGDAELPVGDEVGEYVIEALLGKGGFGTVYRAGHPVIGKQVAIKVLARKYAADPAVIQRFAAEARAVNQINHRNNRHLPVQLARRRPSLLRDGVPPGRAARSVPREARSDAARRRAADLAGVTT